MSTKPLALIKIVSGKTLGAKESLSSSKARSSSAETRISLKNIILKKNKENLIPREKIPQPKVTILKESKLQKLNLNVKEINNSFYKRLNDLEPKLCSLDPNIPIPQDLISPVKTRRP
jgi:hypothetical protein